MACPTWRNSSSCPGFCRQYHSRVEEGKKIVSPARLASRNVAPFKAIVSPNLGARTVLTNGPWGFVSLWLKRNKKDEALFYWNQASEFAAASADVSLQSSPLFHYYAFMNAAKALLAAKGVKFSPYHGVTAANLRKPGARIALSNEGVVIQAAGVLPSLSAYLGEVEAQQTHSLQQLFFNMPFIHRTYCLTYSSQVDMFFPLKDCRYVVDTVTKDAYLSAKLSENFANARYLVKLPSSMAPDPAAGHDRIRSVATAKISSRYLTSESDRRAIVALNKALRSDIVYIHGAQTLWYVKGVVAGTRRLARFPVTLALAAMHRLSELCRYRPFDFEKLLAGQTNWLISEFIEQTPDQYIDSLASEITGYNFMSPNVRPAT
jgi:hypothetical protein